MPSEDLEVVRSILEAWAAGDFRSPAARFDAGVTFETWMPDSDETVVARGAAELEAFTREWFAQWNDYRIVALGPLREVGPGRVFVPVRQSGTGCRSGAVVEAPGFTVWTLRDGRVIELSLHREEAAAVEAARR